MPYIFVVSKFRIIPQNMSTIEFKTRNHRGEAKVVNCLPADLHEIAEREFAEMGLIGYLGFPDRLLIKGWYHIYAVELIDVDEVKYYAVDTWDVDSVKILALNSALSVTEVTGSDTGYPEPITGFAVHGFSDFQSAQEFAETNRGEVRYFRTFNGWKLCNVGNPAGAAWTASDLMEDYPNGELYTSEAEFISTWTDLHPGDVDPVISDLAAKIERHATSGEASVIEYRKDGTPFIIDTLPAESMSRRHDTRTDFIGVYISYES